MSEYKPDPQLASKFENRETLSVTEIAKVQREVLKAVAKKILAGASEPGFEIAFRNPAVFFESIDQNEFASLPEDVQRKVRFVAESSWALKGVAEGKDREQNTLRSSDKFKEEIGGKIHDLQALIRDNKLSAFSQRFAGLLALELSSAFDSAWTQASKEGWHETTDKGRVSYYSGNAIAGGRWYLPKE